MVRGMRGGTVIGSGLKIEGNVSAEGLVELNGQIQIEGNVRCTSLVISPNAQIVGSITAERVVVNGRVEGPIQDGDVVLKSVGDIRHQSLTIESTGLDEASPNGRLSRRHTGTGHATDRMRRNGHATDRMRRNKEGRRLITLRRA
jgi:cytoskeletal protein CcmA (bactofilin family)